MHRIPAYALLLMSMVTAAMAADTGTPLREGWKLQSACKATEGGETIASEGFHPTGWIATAVPSTVLAAQVAAGIYPDPYFGTNLRKLPGETYPEGRNFSNLPMPEDSPYRCGWWYRTEFPIPAADKGKTLWLHFGGINYSAEIWLNGRKIADRSQVAGAYRTYDFDVTGFAKPGQRNVLAVETFAQTDKDLGMTWVDWNPSPPDKDLGLWRGVSYEATGPVSLRSPMAVTHFTDPSLRRAELTLYAELHNASDKTVSGKVSGTAANVPVSQAVTLAPHQDMTVVFAPDKFPQLRLHNPHLWWPWVMGDPHLENLTLRFVADGRISDEKTVQFGIREVTSELTDKGYRLFRINGKPILIRGGGWSPDMMLRENPDRLRDEFHLVRNLGLNTIRLEGKMESDDFFRLADQQGILVMLGWCCCDQWEHWKDWTPENYSVAAESLRSQMLRMRSHASVLVWLNGSDNAPPPFVETAYLRIEADTHWPNPTLAAASKQTTTVGPDGVKMTGPYDYVSPSYWYVDSTHGGAYGFNTETSPGPDVPHVASLRKFIPPDQLWPTDDAAWNLHNGGGGFKTLTVFDAAMKATYATPSSAEEYSQLAQTLSYDSERAMYEAYSRNKYTSTGVIQWMLNNAWPSMIWHLFDYYLDADGGYFGAKKACEPLHVQYSYDDHSIVVVNSTYAPAPHLTASVHVYDLSLKPLFSADKEMDSAADSSARVISVPDSVFQKGSQVYFVDLALKNASGSVISRNFYWIPAKLTTFDWAKTDYTHTPAVQYANMQALRSLPGATVVARIQEHGGHQGRTLQLVLRNPSNNLAFQVAAAVRTSKDGLVAPVFWSDNYIELMPGESRTLTAVLPENAPPQLSVHLTGWNIPERTISLPGGSRETASLAHEVVAAERNGGTR